MFKMILRGSLILTLPVLAFIVNANTLPGKDTLASQCRDLAQTVASLVSSQQKNACVEKLLYASLQIDSAGNDIVDDFYSSAKQELDDAVHALQFAELNSCNRYIQISHSKFEAQRIKNAL